MFRNGLKWLVAALGSTLLCWGVWAMWTGWGVVQVERGWSLFIGGAATLGAGAVILSVAGLMARIDALGANMAAATAAALRAPPASAPVAIPQKTADAAPVRPAAPSAAKATARVSDARRPPAPAATQSSSAFDDYAPRGALVDDDIARMQQPKEVDRYEANDTTYVMFSDGSVEVSRDGVSKRYESLAQLRADAAQRFSS